jgi:predicted nucleic acid-binding protein
VVDSSAWLEYFADGSNAGYFAEAIEAPDQQLVPVITLCEVFKRLSAMRGESAALQAVALMQQGTVVDVSVSISLSAARLSLQHQLPMADSIILATARAYDAELWTQDAGFAAFEGVHYYAK